VNNLVALFARHVELEELSLASGFFERCEVLPAMSHEVKLVIMAVKPDGASKAHPRLCGQSKGFLPRLRALHDQIERHIGNESARRMVRNDIEMVIRVLARLSLDRLCLP
jgi:hypothetical protein